MAGSLVEFLNRTANLDSGSALKNRRLATDVQVDLFPGLVLDVGRVLAVDDGLSAGSRRFARTTVALLLGAGLWRRAVLFLARLLVALGHHLLAYDLAPLGATAAGFRALSKSFFKYILILSL